MIVCDECKYFTQEGDFLHCMKYTKSFFHGYEARAFAKKKGCENNEDIIHQHSAPSDMD